MPIVSVVRAAPYDHARDGRGRVPLEGSWPARRSAPVPRGNRRRTSENHDRDEDEHEADGHDGAAKARRLGDRDDEREDRPCGDVVDGGHVRGRAAERRLRQSPPPCRMRARTGKAVILIEMPMKSANGMNVAPAAARSVKRKYARLTPSR
jgi:hypothetical protein